LLAAAATPRHAAHEGFGALHPARDLETGRELLLLPRGFSYRTLGWAGTPLADGTPTPRAHDGMGIVAAHGSTLTLVRNHEMVHDDGAFGPRDIAWDRAAGGGTVTLEIDAGEATLKRAWPSLSGTLQNCAGGITPWGTWLSCEEYVHEEGPKSARSRDEGAKFLTGLTREHGFVFEVDPAGAKPPVPLYDMGQFRHEAAVVHARSGIVYLTEDREPVAGFYRFLPKQPGRLAAGGRLQMLQAVGASDLRRGLSVGPRGPVRGVAIAEPGRGHSAGTTDGRGVVRQGIVAGGTRFTRLEGIFATDSTIWFTATNGGDAACGQVFAYHPADEEIALLVESPGREFLDYPDNLCFSPRGGLVLCEDSKRDDTQHLYGMTPAGEIFPFARSNMVLDKALHGFRGDYRGAEWAGSCFSPDGRWLFANLYDPGCTVAITGPWREGLI
jgi:secreted PhoX family phosphatase